MVTIEEHLAKLETELLPENRIEADYRSSRNTVRPLFTHDRRAAAGTL